MTGFPPSRGGENFHCRAARTASSWSRGCTDMGLTLRTTPLSSTISSSTAVVLMFRFEGSGGRLGSFFLRTDACRVSGSRRTNLGRFASLVLFDVWESAGEKWAHKRNDMRQHNRLRPDIEASKPDLGETSQFAESRTAWTGIPMIRLEGVEFNKVSAIGCN